MSKITLKERMYPGLIEITCEAPAPLCHDEKHVVAVISHRVGGKWIVYPSIGDRKACKTRADAEAYVRNFGF